MNEFHNRLMVSYDVQELHGRIGCKRKHRSDIDVSDCLETFLGLLGQPIPLLIHCPLCSARHIDEGEWAERAHHTHSCQSCGHTWRPAVVNTVGVRFLPGFKNGPGP